MRKWMEEYAELLLTGVAGSLLITLFIMSGILVVIGSRGKLKENSYEQYRDFNAFTELCQQKKPEILCRTDRQWYAGEAIPVEEAFEGKDGRGNPVEIKIVSIADKTGKSYMNVYEGKTNKVIFPKAGIYVFELKAQDEQKLSAVRQIEFPVDNRKVAQ